MNDGQTAAGTGAVMCAYCGRPSGAVMLWIGGRPYHKRCTEPPEPQDIARLRARVANLEMVLHGMWAMLKDLQPPAAQYGIDSMMSEHFDAMCDMGVESGATFERA